MCECRGVCAYTCPSYKGAVAADRVANYLFSPQLAPVKIRATWTNSRFQVQSLGITQFFFFFPELGNVLSSSMFPEKPGNGVTVDPSSPLERCVVDCHREHYWCFGKMGFKVK
jgi:hypothetical protein